MNFKKLFSVLFKKSNNNEEICNLNKSKKLFFTGHEELSISASHDAKAKDVSELAYKIMQKYIDKPNFILRYIEAKGTKVVLAPKLALILKIIGYEPGFIPAHQGIKAGILNFAIQIASKEAPNFALCVPDLFLCCKKELSLYFLSYQFHHWLSYQYKLPGYDMESMSLFKNTFNTNSSLHNLSINQILALKDTVERDKQALDFVQKFVREQVGAKERLNSIIAGKAVKI